MQVGKAREMTDLSKDLLTTTEGVDEGSAASTAEGPGSGGSPEAGQPVSGPPDTSEAPVDMETHESREQAGPGQQLEVGEG